VRSRNPDVLFLSEAFTRRARLRVLAKAGFSQSYTYFTWKNSRWELTEYMHELAYWGMQEYCRPHFFVNTPDILNAYLVHGGPPAFEARLVLAATLSPSYGIYSGFEWFENVPVREGSEEYVDSEKYELKQRRLDGPLLPLIGRINAARRENAALRELSNVTFLETENEALIAYAKRSDHNLLITVVSIDPHVPQEGLTIVPASLGLAPVFGVHDQLDGARYDWRIGRNYVRLAPGERMAHVLRVDS
jgi:starch synthase (maltosyl-transferring)